MPRADASQPVLDTNCPLRLMFDLVGDRWTTTVLFVIDHHVKRYSELQRQIPGISKKMLKQTLRHLERAGLVDRTVYAVVPPRTEYQLTPMGKSVLEPIGRMADWAVQHHAELKAIFGDRCESPNSSSATRP